MVRIGKGKEVDEEWEWNRLSFRMNRYHDSLRKEFRAIETTSLAEEGVDSIVIKSETFIHNLHAHHQIEETTIFPILGQRMENFSGTFGNHLLQHSQIESSLEKLENYIDFIKKSPEQYNSADLRLLMCDLKSILFYHLDLEVESLAGENLKKFWSLEEVKLLPMGGRKKG